MELVQIYFKKFNKVEVISHFLAFVQFLVDNFTLLDPDPAGKMNAYPCGSGSMRIWINADPCPCGIGYTALHQFLHSVCINIVIRGKLTTRASVLRIRIGSDPNLLVGSGSNQIVGILIRFRIWIWFRIWIRP